MDFTFHNKLVIETGKKNYTFFNNVNLNLITKLQQKRPYNKYLSIGTGNSTSQNQMKLSTFLKTYELTTEFTQSDLSKGQPYIKKSLVIKNELADGITIKEMGLSDTGDNPDLYNYFSCISDELPNGIVKKHNEDIYITIFVYLNIDDDSKKYLCAGNNRWIEFLLGNGLPQNIYAIRGNNIIQNKTIKKENIDYDSKFLMNLCASIENNNLIMEYEQNIGTGTTYEIILIVENNPIARINVLNQNEPITTTVTLTPVRYDVIDCGKNVISVNSVTNTTTNEAETNYIVKKYASDYADQISVPFNNMFNNLTPRFLSDNGKYIFFVSDDYIYGYENSDYEIKQILTNNLRIFSVNKIIICSNFVFIVSKVEPYLTAYLIENHKLNEIEIDFKEFNKDFFSDLTNVGVAKSDNTIMVGCLSSENHATTLYFDYANTTLTYTESVISEYNFSLILAMSKNNYETGKIMYAQTGEYSYETLLATHYSDKTKKEIYSILAYEFTKDVKETYVKDRGVVVETSDEQKVYLYIYPGVYKYSLPSIDGADDYYFSNDLTSVITKTNNELKLYSLVGYKDTTEFSRNLFSKVSPEKILDFEFLNDTLLIFLADENNPIIAYNLFIDSAMIENVSSENDSYEISLTKYNLLGENNKSVNVKFVGTVKIWFLVKDITNFLTEKMPQSQQLMKN